MNRNHVRAVCAEFGVTAGLGTTGFEALREMIVQHGEADADTVPCFVAQTYMLELLSAIDKAIGSLTDRSRRGTDAMRRVENSRRFRESGF